MTFKRFALRQKHYKNPHCYLLSPFFFCLIFFPEARGPLYDAFMSINCLGEVTET